MGRLTRVAATARRKPVAAASLGLGAVILLGWTGLLGPLVTLAVLVGVGWMFWTWPHDASGRLVTAPAPVKAAPEQSGGARVRVHAPALVWPVILVFAAVGVFVLGLAGKLLVEQETRLWNARAVEATVIRSTIERPSKSRRGGHTYAPHVLHRYTFNGRTYESNDLHLQPQHLPEPSARAAIALYRPGTRVFTHVPEGRPDAAFLIARREWGLFGLIPLGLASLGVAVLAAWAVLTSRAGR